MRSIPPEVNRHIARLVLAQTHDASATNGLKARLVNLADQYHIDSSEIQEAILAMTHLYNASPSIAESA